MAKGEISVELRLALSNLKSDLKKANSLLKNSLTVEVGTNTKSISTAVTAQKTFAQSIKSASVALKEQKLMLAQIVQVASGISKIKPQIPLQQVAKTPLQTSKEKIKKIVDEKYGKLKAEPSAAPAAEKLTPKQIKKAENAKAFYEAQAEVEKLKKIREESFLKAKVKPWMTPEQAAMYDRLRPTAPTGREKACHNWTINAMRPFFKTKLRVLKMGARADRIRREVLAKQVLNSPGSVAQFGH